MAPTKVEKLVPRNPNALQFALYTGTLPTVWQTIVPKGNVSVSDAIGTTTYPDFASALGQIAAMATDGFRTVSISFSAYLIPGDAPFLAAFDAYKNTKQVAFRERGIARDGVAAEFAQVYVGFISSFNRTYNETGVAEVALTFGASADITPPVA